MHDGSGGDGGNFCRHERSFNQIYFKHEFFGNMLLVWKLRVFAGVVNDWNGLQQ